MPSLKKEWELTKEAFDGLLECLSPDHEQAAEAYEETRRKLITFFEFRGCLFPQDKADETINRVARRIQEGEVIHAPDVASYFYGIARNVLREYWKNVDRTLVELRPHDSSIAEAPDEVTAQRTLRLKREQRLECLDKCLESLPEDARRMILLYYRDEKGAQIRTRQLLAEELGIADYALRLRVSRVRAKLDACINRCLNE